MTLLERKAALIKLGEYLLSDDDYLKAVIKRSSIHNPWFTEKFQNKAIQDMATQMLDQDKLTSWLEGYSVPDDANGAKNIGMIMAGNIPLAGLHDLICVFVSGHKAFIKLSDEDPYLMPSLLRALKQIDKRTESYFQIVERLSGFEAIIASGKRDSMRYFKTYFGKYPHIIRKNRSTVAVLNGDESETELLALGKDVFNYFGLGSRNVSKLYVPLDYNFDPLLEALHEYRQLVVHTKYKNNFDYQYALYILNKVQLKANGCILMSENTVLQSPIACLHYEYYSERELLEKELQKRDEEIDIIVGQQSFEDLPVYSFGEAHKPSLPDYLDRVDTMTFLLDLF